METNDIRWKQRFANFASSLTDLRSALQKTEYTVLERAGLIQLFEVSFELAWKTLKDFLVYEGNNVNSPREVLRQAFANGLIEEGELWLQALDARNQFSHLYNKQMAEEAVTLINETFAPLLFTLKNALDMLCNALTGVLLGDQWSHGNGQQRTNGLDQSRISWLDLRLITTQHP